MPAITFKPRVKETSTTTGTGNITLAGAVVGYQSFDDAFAVTTDYFHYCIEAVDGNGIPTGQWEEGIGHLSASTTLVRDTLLSSSTGSAVSFSAGTKNVFCTVAARDFERLHSNVPKAYRAKVSQTGTGNPTVDVVLENTIGTLTWARSSVGLYTLTGAANTFPTENQVFCPIPRIRFFNGGDVDCYMTLVWADTETIYLTTYDNTLSNTEAEIIAQSIEIYVYP